MAKIIDIESARRAIVTPGRMVNIWKKRVLPFNTAGTIDPTTRRRRIEETEEIPSRIFSLSPLSMTPSVAMSGIIRAMSSL